jgi:ankyrin repeat protein
MFHQRVYVLIGTLIVLIATSSCRIDTSSAYTALLKESSPGEQLFLLEVSDAIQAQQNLSSIGQEACRLGHVRIARFLYRMGARFNDSDLLGWNSLLEAAGRGDLATLRFLVEEAEANIRSRTEERVTALMLAALGGHQQIVVYLIDRGANINAKTNHNATPLMYAAAGGNQELVTILLQRGALIQAEDFSGKAALDYAKDDSMREFLLDRGAKPRSGSDSL